MVKDYRSRGKGEDRKVYPINEGQQGHKTTGRGSPTARAQLRSREVPRKSEGGHEGLSSQ